MKEKYHATLKLKTEQEIIEERIERTVQEQEADRRGITVNTQALYENLLQSYCFLKSNAQSQPEQQGM